jgi:hypothetical protein
MTKLAWRMLAASMFLALFGASPARAEWKRAESPHFIVYGNVSEQALRERIGLLEDFDRLMRVITSVNGPPAPTKLNIFILGSGADLRAVHNIGTGVAGFYTATPDGIGAFIDGRQPNANEILFHEYAHHFMMQYAPNAYPLWYIEGFAEYFMTARFTPRAIDIGNFSRGRVAAIENPNWLPMDRILFGDLQGLNDVGMQQFYAQAWLTVHYFYSSPERRAVLRRYLAMARAGDPRAAFQSATGIAPAQFGQELRRYIGPGQVTYHQMPRERSETPPPVTVMSVAGADDELMVFQAALTIGVDEPAQAALLQRLRASAARHQGNALASRLLGHAEALYGDSAAADRLLDGLLASAPHDAELLYLKGMRHLIAAEHGETRDEAEARRARDFFSRAHNEDENQFQTLYRYAESLRGDPAYVSENTSNVLLLAHDLAPQVSEITMNAAVMLMSRGEYGRAIGLLAPLSSDPHNASLARAARNLIEQATAHLNPNARMPAAPAAPTAPAGKH